MTLTGRCSHERIDAVLEGDDIIVLVPHEHDAPDGEDGEPAPSPGPGGRTFPG